MFPHRGKEPPGGKNNALPMPKGKLPIEGAKMAITAGKFTEKEQIDLMVERFTQTYNYKSFAEMDRQFNCHQLEDAIHESHQSVLDQLRLQHREYKQKALANRQKLLTELAHFRSSISKIICEDVPKLVQIYQASSGNASAQPSANTPSMQE